MGTIVDDDAEPTLSINDVSVNEGNFGQNAAFRVSLSAPSGKPVSFKYATVNGTATAGRDYYANESGGTVRTIAPGATSYDIGVSIIGDNIYEPDETFFLNIFELTNASAAKQQGKATNVNDY